MDRATLVRGKKNEGRGVTLVELLVAMAVSIIIGAAVVGAFLSGQRSFITGINAVELHGDARVAMSYLAKDIKSARGAAAVGITTLSLTIPSIDGTGNIIASTFDTVVYSLNGTDLQRVVAPDASSARVAVTMIVANNVNGLSFDTGTLPNSVIVVLPLQKTVLGGRLIAETLQSTISLRNVD